MFSAPLLHRRLDAALRDLASPSPATRAEAVADLARHAEDSSDQVHAALRPMLRDPDGGVRAAAAGAVADLGATELLPELLELAGDDDPRARQMALTALGELGDERASPRLERALADDRADVRFQAVIAFPRVCADGPRAWAAIHAATRDRDPEVARIALRVADEVAAREPTPVPGELLARAGELLRAEHDGLRLAAAVLLGGCGDDRGKHVLLDAARRALKGVDPEDEAAAVELLGELDVREAIPALERRLDRMFGLLRDPLAWHVQVALARLGHDKSRRAILRALASPDASLRVPAIVAAGRARLDEARAALLSMQERGEEPREAVDEAVAALETRT